MTANAQAHTIKTHVLGYPRIGEKRELKKATESFWKGQISLEELKAAGRALRSENWAKQKAAGIDLIPTNDFSFYDQMLDLTCLVGNVPARFGWTGGTVAEDTLFLIARGSRDAAEKTTAGHQHEPGQECAACAAAGGSSTPTFASEMTKWFDTNYHFIVPEFRADTQFALSSSKIFNEYEEARAQNINAKPTIIGPVTYLSLGKVQDSANPDFDPFTLLDSLVHVYIQVLIHLANLGAEWVQIDEPVFALDLSPAQQDALISAYSRISRAIAAAPTPSGKPLRLLVASYFGPLRENKALFLGLPVDALHFDATRAPEEVDDLLANFPASKILSLGIVDGRNIWKNDFDASLAVLTRAKAALGESRLWIAPSCSLQHSPITLKNEPKLDTELKSWLAFADQKLEEVVALRGLTEGALAGTPEAAALESNRRANASRRTSTRIHNADVKARVAAIAPGDYNRASAFACRQVVQRQKLKLPEFPTTTIGSFPQTAEVRAARARWKKGELTDAAYDAYLKEEIAACVRYQEAIGIDMPVHGEFERNDMVEYFGEQLQGFAFTANGWVQSYGSRYVKPPVIFGDVSRPQAMTVAWSEYAQSLTKLPMKGMLTGPVTILQWSFVRNDQPRSVTATQIGLAIRDEVVDLEKVNIAAIQIDEPAVREGLPLRKSDWPGYLEWAVNAFRLCASGVRDETQIHTHMCYSEFNDIISAIADMDADVITIETSRSNMELLEAFVDFSYPNEIGPGVYDIHSPRVPAVEEMVNLMRKAEAVVPRGNLWVNPDCGLKTRGWPEVRASLENMVAAAKDLRASVPVATS
ncbi:MAG TPA: 5-methyltetrahydropteroyltriglutamate--homocysteine S-methyltransferase [Candidatus Methylacidiphilales bacterium]|nr:5-methyltetrahydropteroyltriglutamate--homocysteine S-methyltransferase [Candidatus Methylacidiphilales bacterium]